MKKILFVLFISFIFLFLHAEEENPFHHISLYLGGPASVGSIEYDYSIIQKPRMSLGLSLGVGANFDHLSLPMGAIFTYGGRDQMLLGIHYVPFISTSLYEYYHTAPTVDNSHFSIRAGYRKNFVVRDEDFFFQIFFSPLIKADFSSVSTFVGVGFGACL